jgi:hypothetical protein
MELRSTALNDLDEQWRQVKNFCFVAGERNAWFVRATTVHNLEMAARMSKTSITAASLAKNPLTTVAALSPESRLAIAQFLQERTKRCRSEPGLLRFAVASEVACLFMMSADRLLKGQDSVREVYSEIEILIAQASKEMISRRAECGM